MSVIDFIEDNAELEENNDCLGLGVQKATKVSILSAIAILKMAMIEQSLPLHDEIKKLERAFEIKFIEALKQDN